MLKIQANFDGGNIKVVKSQGQQVQLSIKTDHQANYFQWFYFCVEAKTLEPQHLTLINARASSYPDGWSNYQAVASHDRQHWFRVPTTFDGEQLHIHYRPLQRLTFYAYFVPYSYERYLDFIARHQVNCAVEPIAESCDGRSLHLLTFGNADPAKQKIWFIARQHAGEIMASWFVEGLVEKLSNQHDPHVKRLLAEATIYVVPHMNPDGAIRGHLRANAKGVDLNRQWQNPDKRLAPEVHGVRQKMQEIGVDFFVDVHGDETIPHVFLADATGNPSCTVRQSTLTEAFCAELLRLTPDFQTQYGYSKGQFSNQQLTLACNHVADAFAAVAFTLEMPFKDHQDLADVKHGWSPQRSGLLAVAVVHALLAFLPKLR